MKNLEYLQNWLKESNEFKLGSLSLPLVVETSKGSGRYKVCSPTITVPRTGDIFSKNSVFKYRGLTQELLVSDESGWAGLSKEHHKNVRDLISQKVSAESVAPTESLMPESTDKSDTTVVKEPVIIEEVDESIDFKSMTKKEIDSWASEKGIDVDGRLSKTDMIAFVESELVK